MGGFGSFLQWLDLKPKDLALSQSITIPHALWLLLAIALSATGIGASVWSGILQKREIQRLKSQSTAKPVLRVKTPGLGRVDLRGQILEFLLASEDDWVMPRRFYVAIRVQIVNHGEDEATITSYRLHVSLGSFEDDGAVIANLPAAWCVRRRKQNSFAPAYEDMRPEPRLNATNIYKKGIPVEGWLFFELYEYGDVELPNVQVDLLVKDSFAGEHVITREAGVYPQQSALARDGMTQMLIPKKQ